MSRRTRHVGYAVILAALAAIAALTLRSHPRNVDLVVMTPLTCLVCGELGAVDVIMNVLLFVPLGAGLALAGFSWPRALILSFITTLFVELLQMKVLVGRDASLSDLLTNTAGGGLGCWLAAAWRGWLLPAVPAARRLLGAGAVLWLSILAGTAWLLAPSLPLDTYYGQWAPNLAHLETFPGRVLSAAVDGDPLPPGPALDSRSLRERLLVAPTVVTATAVADERTWGLAPIVSVFDEHQREIFILGQLDRDLVFRLRTRAAALRLRTPAVRLAGALEPAREDTARLEGGLEGRRLFVRRSSAAGERSYQVPLTPTLGWALLLPFHYSMGPERRLASAAWSAALLLLLGYWAARAGGAAPLLLGGLAALALAGLPRVFGMDPLPWSDWLGTALGGMIGLACGRAGLRWEHPQGGEAAPPTGGV